MGGCWQNITNYASDSLFQKEKEEACLKSGDIHWSLRDWWSFVWVFAAPPQVHGNCLGPECSEHYSGGVKRYLLWPPLTQAVPVAVKTFVRDQAGSRAVTRCYMQHVQGNEKEKITFGNSLPQSSLQWKNNKKKAKFDLVQFYASCHPWHNSPHLLRLESWISGTSTVPQLGLSHIRNTLVHRWIQSQNIWLDPEALGRIFHSNEILFASPCEFTPVKSLQ